MPPSTLYQQCERLVADGFPLGELMHSLEISIVPLYDYSLSGAVDQWLKTRGLDTDLEKKLNKGGRLAAAIRDLDRQWLTWRKEKTMKRLEFQANTPRKILNCFVVIGIITFIALFLIVGMTEMRQKHLPRFGLWLQQILQETGHLPGQKQEQQKQQKQDDGFGRDQGSGGLLPSPPPGFVSWFTWAVKRTGMRELLADMRGAAGRLDQCTCGDYRATGHDDAPQQQEKQRQQPSARDNGEDLDEQQPVQQEEKKDGASFTADGDGDAEPASGTDDPAAAGKKNNDNRNVDAASSQSLLPSDSGKRFISRAANVLRKSTGALNVENTGKDSDSDEQASSSSSSFDQGEEEKKKRRKKMQQSRNSGVLQPAFLLESDEDAYNAHVGWLAHRFDPPLPVVELVWRDLETAEHLSDFLFWNTGWGTVRGGQAASCCVILSLPHAIAPIARVRNVTRNSAVPFLVEKLSSVASSDAFSVQSNVGCKALVVARADPTTKDIRDKRTYKRMRNLFASFIL